MMVSLIYYAAIAALAAYTRSYLLSSLLVYLIAPMLIAIAMVLVFIPLIFLVWPVMSPLTAYGWPGKDWIWPNILYSTSMALPAAICRFNGHKRQAPIVYLTTLLFLFLIASTIMDHLGYEMELFGSL